MVTLRLDPLDADTVAGDQCIDALSIRTSASWLRKRPSLDDRAGFTHLPILMVHLRVTIMTRSANGPRWCQHGPVRDTRVIYVENDPALRGIMTRSLQGANGIDLLLETGSAREALASPEVSRADVALVDLALGVDEPNGIDLGLGLRQRNPDIGIVVYSQYSMRNLVRRVPDDQRIGWSFIPKTGDMRTEDLVEILRATARGLSHDGTETSPAEPTDHSLLDDLSHRQRAIMALAATGLTAPEIAARLGASHDAVRKELSKSYRILVPDTEGGDLRTKAVLAYLQLVRDSSWDGVGS